ncbi:MAG: HAD family hydrolase [Solirubrobacterales bacterium]
MIAAVIFDLDGLLIDSERAWDQVRRAYAEERGGHWRESATRDMMGMSSVEWSRYVHEELGVDLPPERISEEVAARVGDLYERRLPLLPGAVEAVERIGERWPLGLASSSNRELIDRVLEVAGIASRFRATVSSEEVDRGKPAPDVYLETAKRLEVAPGDCAAIEDSHNGILSAAAAGMRVIAIPNSEFPPGDEALARADQVLESLAEVTPEAIQALPSS